ncbi:MAG: hypothetical protein IH598_02955 [Bacteroidales bacterium]|nr:hypothetical protein [Bacteroidales bacterium]
MINFLKVIVTILLITFCGFKSFGQQADDGKVYGTITYKSASNVYVRFESTETVKAGDTLYFQRDGVLIPALVVESLSSISCLCAPIEGINLSVGDKISTFPKIESIGKNTIPPEVEEVVLLPFVTPQSDTIESQIPARSVQQEISGRFSISSYSDFSNTIADDGQRMRYVMALNMKNIRESRLSFKSYISFSHRNNVWDEIKSNIHNGLKIYNLSLHYQVCEDKNLWFGRMINPKVSSLGAVDGIQFEKKFNKITVGALAGSRPDWTDYSYNFKLFQAGIYASHELAKDKLTMLNTIAIVDQENDWNTDRRFLYIQHSSRIVKKVYFFGSGEFDLYKKLNDQQQNTFNLSNLYLQLRYRMFSNFSVSLAYSARNNLILYETYKSFIEKLLETETLQGFVLSANLRPVRNIDVGVKAGYRNRPGDMRSSKNLYTYVNFARLPVWGLSANITAIFLETGYLKGKVYGVRLSRDLIRGTLYASAGYRHNKYDYFNQEYSLAQDLLELNLNLQMKWKMFASLNYESTFDKSMKFYRVYVNLTKRL